MKKIKGFTLIELVIVVVIIAICGVLILGGVGSCGCGQGCSYSDGSRNGIIYKFSKKGIAYKTWEGEMSLALTTRNAENNLVNEIFYFSVSNESVAEKINKAMESGEKVTVKYNQYLMRSPKLGSTQYDVYAVSPVK